MKPRLALAFAAGSALLLIALAARGTSPVPLAAPDPADATAPNTTGSLIGMSDQDVEPSVVGGSLVVLMVIASVLASIVVIGLLVGLLGWFDVGRRRGRGVVAEPLEVLPDVPSNPEVLARGARTALRELRARDGGPPGDAVVAAWLALEHAARESGVERRPHQTPTEFTGDLLGRHRVDEAATIALRTTYHRARFGTTGLTTADVTRVEAALDVIVRDLAADR
ncbi:DUF4129 domain-containing protein [Actinosynnema sp. NPDC020468]|uniref:DUF4129 domain-containing protein n=1 Tax=Actinosynnema sp. NPDC020468 TaxID=3154488 RepID=UPI0033EAF5D4